MLGEMFPNRIRGAALGLAAAGQWAANWLITVTFPQLREHPGVAYGFYALCAILSGLFVWKWVMETKGVSLEDMHAELLHEEKPTRPDRPAVPLMSPARQPDAARRILRPSKQVRAPL